MTCETAAALRVAISFEAVFSGWRCKPVLREMEKGASPTWWAFAHEWPLGAPRRGLGACVRWSRDGCSARLPGILVSTAIPRRCHEANARWEEVHAATHFLKGALRASNAVRTYKPFTSAGTRIFPSTARVLMLEIRILSKGGRVGDLDVPGSRAVSANCRRPRASCFEESDPNSQSVSFLAWLPYHKLSAEKPAALATGSGSLQVFRIGRGRAR